LGYGYGGGGGGFGNLLLFGIAAAILVSVVSSFLNNDGASDYGVLSQATICRTAARDVLLSISLRCKVSGLSPRPLSCVASDSFCFV
jgi:uncharacterized membrane protein